MNHTPSADVPAPLRRVAPPDAPFPGEILASPHGAVYRVAATRVPHEMWSARSGGHLLAPDDVDRVADETLVILPLLRARLCGADAAFDLTSGQAVTLVVSVLRGAVDAARSEWRTGEWWSTSDGRPVLVPTGARGWEISSRTVLGRIPDAALSPDIRQRVGDALADRITLPFAAPGLEDDLFAVASPEPFVIAPPMGLHRPSGGAAGESPSADAAVVARSAAAGLVDGELMGRVSTAIAGTRAALQHATGLLSRQRRRPERSGEAASAGRRRVMWVALAAVGATVAIGLSLPYGRGGDQGSAGDVPASEAEEQPRAEAGSPDPSAGGDAPGDDRSSPSSRVETPPTDPDLRVVDDLADCLRSDDPACRAAVLERPDAALPEGIATADAPREVRLLDDLGGVEVVRVDDPSGERPSQIVVVVTHDEKRLVRDVYDVADQP
ncbi:hypothetical protein CBF90_08005 [Microbacterium sp. AISO3]|uniref:hypothetical protein n=1 Tax=Microbacterium sp. AISO3 TaxID=2002831 RepID=UPI000B4C9212|nr:hypothetical protein [Microbacterium sp. AISO3]OWP22146.1 hypothetical protein CBF90_08005 [Microbacterium sp. AISO3]